MAAPIYREILEKFYCRVYVDQRPVRFLSIAIVALLTAWLRVWSLADAVAWGLVYAAGEFALIAWWSSIQPRLKQANEAEVDRLKAEMIAICAAACAICVIPCFFTPFAGRDSQIVGVIISASVLLVAAAEHSLAKSMFLVTTPAAIAALLWNLFSLGHGPASWIFAFVGLCYVFNARTLQLSNTRVFQDLVRLRVEAESANLAKSAFLATMSHEIRTPLNGVLGMAQILQSGDLAPRQREQVNVIADAGKTLLTVLNGILDLSKIEAGKLELEAHAFDLEETLKAAIAPYASLAARKGLDLSLTIASQARGRWRGDGAKLVQVLSNLASNAVKFTAQGAIQLAVDVAPGGLAFRVTDTGIGVASDKVRLIFDPFTQADASTTRRFGGTGLGLAISHRLVALLGGELTLASQPGIGSTFAFILPLERTDEAADSSPAAESHLAGDPARTLRILAADDNAINRLVLQAMLAPLGAEVVLANDGREALDAAEVGDFDLILMDVQMPRMDGVEATAAIRGRERSSGRLRTPIIALTANVMNHQVDAYRAAGMDGFVAKPIEIAALAQAIDAALLLSAVCSPNASWESLEQGVLG